MTASSSYEKVECKTIDGTLIRGWLYAAAGMGPGLIMTPGFNCVKEMLLPEIAEMFRAAGYHVLIYDPRATGDSEGMPRGQIDPLQQAEDLSDIITYMASLPLVDANRIGLWGMSFGGTVSGCATAVDRRVRALVMVCPILGFFQREKRAKALAQLTRDRQSQLRGNEPLTLPPFNSRGENPIGMAGSGGPGGLEAYGFMNAILDRGAPGFRNRITLQTYQKLAVFYPKEILGEVDTTPVMVVTPELDAMSPPEEQRALFDRFKQQKRFYLTPGKGHLTVLSGEGSHDAIQAQIDFVGEVLGMPAPDHV